MLVYATLEDDLERRDPLLNELRALANQFPADTTVREAFARGLYNTLNDAKQDNNPVLRDQLLDELRALTNQHPADATVGEMLAWGLYDTPVNTKQENSAARSVVG
jgi:hypothetical protein